MRRMISVPSKFLKTAGIDESKNITLSEKDFNIIMIANNIGANIKENNIKNKIFIQHLRYAIRYYYFLLNVKRWDPFYLYHGSKGLSDVIYYIKRISNNTSELRNETIKFLTSGTSIEHLNDRTFGFYHYGKTTSNKIYSRINFFESYKLDIKEKISLKSISHNPLFNILVFVAIAALVTSSILCSSGLTMPAIAYLIFNHLGLSLSLTTSICAPLLFKGFLGLFKPRFQNNIDNKIKSKTDNLPKIDDSSLLIS